ncbi:MAG: WD40 repeat domain-containing protein, partial [Propionibacteriaceae bacterium]|nr:WD40 repeat domain-containing protein [Propionibacteriaceae bacterium]
RTLAAVGGQQTASLWDVTAEPRRLAEFDDVSVAYSLVLSPELLLFGMLDGSIRAWDIANADRPIEASGLTLSAPNAVTALALSPDGRTLAAGGAVGTVDLFDWPARTPMTPLDLPATSAVALGWAPDGRELVAGLSNAEAHRWRLEDAGFTALAPLTGFGSSVNAIAIDEQRIATGSSDNTTKVFDRSGALRATLPGLDIVTSVEIVEGRLLTGAVDGALRWWPADVAPLLHDTGSVFDLVTDRRSWVAASRRGATPALFRVGADNIELLPDPALPDGLDPAVAAAIPDAGDILVSATRTGEIVTWPLGADGAGEPTLSPGVGAWAGLIAITDDGRHLALTRLREAGLVIFERDGQHWRQTQEVPGWHHTITTIPGTSLLGSAVEDGTMRIWDLSGMPREVGWFDPPGVPFTVGASPDGTQLLVAPPTGELLVYDIADPANPTPVAELTSAHATVTSMRFSRDGKLLFATATDERIWVWNWDPAADPALLSMRLASQARATIPLDDRLLIGTADGQVTVRPLLLGQATTQLCAGLGEPLTELEWTRYAPGVTPVAPC